MRGRLGAILLVAVLLAAGPVVLAQSAGDYGSQHETADDFLNATQLVNMQVTGSGESAYVEYDPPSPVYDWTTDHRGSGITIAGAGFTYDDPNDRLTLPTGNMGDWLDELAFRDDLDGQTEVDTWIKKQGDYVALIGTPDKQAYSGSLANIGGAVAMELRVPDNEIRIESGGSTGASQSVTLDATQQYWAHYEVVGDDYTITLYDVDGNGDPGTQLATATATYPNKAPDYWGFGAHSASSVDAYQYQWGYSTGSGEAGIYLSDAHDVSESTGGEVVFQDLSSGEAEVEWQAYDGSSWVTLSTDSYTTAGTKTQTWAESSHSQVRVNITATNSQGSPALEISSESVLFDNDPPTLSNPSPVDGEETHNSNVDLSVDVDDPDFSTTQGDNVTVKFYLDNVLEDTVHVESGGQLTTTVSGVDDGDHTWYVEADDSYGATTSSAVRSFSVSHFPPAIDNTTLSPSGELDSSSEHFTVDVSDQDFLHQGDELNASLYIDGTYQGSDILTVDGEANVTAPIGFGGTVEYYWNVTDEYGHATESQRVEIQTPGSIEIREATEPHDLIQEASGELQFYTTGAIYTRNASDGVVEMGGLPKDESFVVVAEAPNHTTRRVFITSLFDTATVYLPHESTTVVQPKFQLQDFTGDFPGENSVMEIQRNIEGDWRTVEGDRFSSINEFTATLLFNERHRLLLTNLVTGEERDLGQYTPTESGTVTIRVSGSTASVVPQYEPAFNFKPDTSSLPRADNVTVNVTVDERDAEIASYNVTFTSGGETVAARDVNGGVDSGFSLDLADAGDTVNATVTWEETDGTTGETTRAYGLAGEFPGATGLLDGIFALGIGTGVGSLLTLVVMGLVIGYSASRLPPVAAAGAGVGVAVGGTLIGWLPVALLAVIGAAFVVLVLAEVNL